jgi:hypothetical protein
LPAAEQLRRTAATAPVLKIDSLITRVVNAGRDTFTLLLADGSVWRTSERARVPPETGDKITIRRAAMGSFLASFAGGRGVRIERLR